MKKLFTISIALIYFAVSSGIIVNMHYCMGKLASWAIGNDNSKSCGKCGMEKRNKGGCCHDEHKFVKSSIDQKTGEANIDYVKAFMTVALDFPEFNVISFPSTSERSYAVHDPPLHHGISIYILNCTYRI